MDPERWERLEKVFLEVCQLPINQQEQFIEVSTGCTEDMKQELRRMLRGHKKQSILDVGIRGMLGEAVLGIEILPFESMGPYRSIRQLGEGGMGVVYLAWREDWEILVAIKIPRDIWISPAQLARFRSEQRLLAQLTHPAIARIYEGGTQVNGTPWFAMEYVDGEPITNYSQRKGLSVRERLRLFLTICDATQYAHSQLIIHRDLKPSNIFITSDGKAKLLDFGIAKQIGEAAHLSILTRSGVHPLTLAYAAPEQILRNEASVRTDIYALGVVLYELLTNKLPFCFSNLNAIQAGEIIREKAPVKPSTVATRTPGLTDRYWDELDVLILKAMHKDVDQRYGTVDALRRDLHHFLANEPLDAKPDSRAYRLEKFVMRNKNALSVAGTVLVLVISLISFFLVSLTRARDAALHEAARTRRLTQLTRSILSGGDADNGPSKNMKVIDMLDLALKRAEALNSDPIQQSQLYTTLGSLYVDLGAYDKADSILHSAYAVLAAHDPVSHEMSEVLLQLGILYSLQSNDSRSLSCMRKALAVEQQVEPPDNSLLFRSRIGIAFALLDSSPRAAVEILEVLLKAPLSDTTEEARSDVWNNLATGYINLKEYAKAEPYARMALAYSQKTHPPIHPDIASELVDLSIIERELRKYSAAERDLRKALEIDASWYPKHHEETADVKRLLANVLYLENRYVDAMPLAREAMMDERKKLGTKNRKTAYAMQMVGALDLKNGDPEEASSLFQQEISSLRVLKDEATLPEAFAYLGDSYLTERRYKRAEDAYREAVALYGSSRIQACDYRAQNDRKLGEALMLQGKFAAAEPPLTASYNACTSNLDSEELRLTRQDLVRVYESLNQNSQKKIFR